MHMFTLLVYRFFILLISLCAGVMKNKYKMEVKKKQLCLHLRMYCTGCNILCIQTAETVSEEKKELMK